MARTSSRAGIGTSARGQAGAPVYSGHAAGAPWAEEAEGAGTLATGQPTPTTGQPGGSAGLGAGAAIRAARLRDAGRALDRGDVRSAVGLLLEAVRGDGAG